MTVTGSGTISVAGLTEIGGGTSPATGGNGTLVIQAGAKVAAASNVFIGGTSASTGTVLISGTGSSLTTPGFLQVGEEGAGYMNVVDGATVSAANLNIATPDTPALASSLTIGSLTASNVAAVSVSGSATVGGGGIGTGGGHTGTGTLTINAYGQLTATGTTKVWNSNSKINLTGGTLTTRTLDTGR